MASPDARAATAAMAAVTPRTMGAPARTVPQVQAVNKCKFVFIGDSSVGKTSIVTRFVHGTFGERYQHTVGVDFLSKSLRMMGERTLRLQIWDTSGQERYQGLIPSFMRDASGVVVVYDVTKRASFESASKWMDYARMQRSGDLTVLLLGSKADLTHAREVSAEEGEQFAKEHRALFMEASAKTGANVAECFETIVTELPEAGFLPMLDSPAGRRKASPALSGKAGGGGRRRGGDSGEEALAPRRCGGWCRMLASAAGI